jgi:hypothetical protein
MRLVWENIRDQPQPRILFPSEFSSAIAPDEVNLKSNCCLLLFKIVTGFQFKDPGTFNMRVVEQLVQPVQQLIP